MTYNWQFPNWAEFTYNDSVIDSLTTIFALETGEIKGVIQSISSSVQEDTILQLMISEAIKSSEIEGEFFSRQDIMSSIKRHLGVSKNFAHVRDKKALGIGALMVEVRNSYQDRLTEKMIKSWHKILMNASPHINAGKYRTGTEPMQVISGAVGREIIHYEAPPSYNIPQEMKSFIKWYNNFKVEAGDIKNALIKTSICHLYFESIHPFEDGNGRIGRAIAEKCLSQSLGVPFVISISSIIERDKKKYYNALKKAQRSLEITNWIFYFSSIILEAQKNAKQVILFTLNKTKFLDKHKGNLNERQLKVILKIFDFGIEGFEGDITAKKYISITKSSRATATRDLQDLVEKNILSQMGAGRNVKYMILF